MAQVYMALLKKLVQFGQNFDIKTEEIIKTKTKNSHEHSLYESVDDYIGS